MPTSSIAMPAKVHQSRHVNVGLGGPPGLVEVVRVFTTPTVSGA